jgi:hypothetical protein
MNSRNFCYLNFLAELFALAIDARKYCKLVRKVNFFSVIFFLLNIIIIFCAHCTSSTGWTTIYECMLIYTSIKVHCHVPYVFIRKSIHIYKKWDISFYVSIDWCSSWTCNCAYLLPVRWNFCYWSFKAKLALL